MSCNEAVELSPDDEEVRKLVAADFQAVEDLFADAIQRGQDDGGLSGHLTSPDTGPGTRARVESSAPSRYDLRASNDDTAVPPSRGCPPAHGTRPSARGHDRAGPVLLSRLDGQVVVCFGRARHRQFTQCFADERGKFKGMSGANRHETMRLAG